MSAPIPQSLFSSRGLTFEDAKRKGSKLMQRIQSRGNKESRWTDYTSLATDSWEISNYEKQRLYLVGLKGPSDEYGWSTEYVEWYGLHEGSGEDEYWTVAAYEYENLITTLWIVADRISPALSLMSKMVSWSQLLLCRAEDIRIRSRGYRT